MSDLQASWLVSAHECRGAGQLLRWRGHGCCEHVRAHLKSVSAWLMMGGGMQ